mmetsp:Transcript_12540/g.34554  ORF Transcript_12540/g.34554 Transcript_12540/m.34554 type:complete len:221 (+) Transcript_12540:182-844(+)
MSMLANRVLGFPTISNHSHCLQATTIRTPTTMAGTANQRHHRETSTRLRSPSCRMTHPHREADHRSSHLPRSQRPSCSPIPQPAPQVTRLGRKTSREHTKATKNRNNTHRWKPRLFITETPGWTPDFRLARPQILASTMVSWRSVKRPTWTPSARELTCRPWRMPRHPSTKGATRRRAGFLGDRIMHDCMNTSGGKCWNWRQAKMPTSAPPVEWYAHSYA